MPIECKSCSQCPVDLCQIAWPQRTAVILSEAVRKTIFPVSPRLLTFSMNVQIQFGDIAYGSLWFN